jgi:hypothetical protein
MDPSGRGAPDEARGFTSEREGSSGGAPGMHEEPAADAPRVAGGDARERSRQSVSQEGDVPAEDESDPGGHA